MSWISELNAAAAQVSGNPGLDPEALYRQLGRLLSDPPNFFVGPISGEKAEWLGRVRMLVTASHDQAAEAEFSMAMNMLSQQRTQPAVDKLMIAAHTALARLELLSPPGVRGAFISAGDSFDAFAALTKVFKSAKRDLMIVDPYLDETALTEFGGIVPSGANYRLLGAQTNYGRSLAVAAQRWRDQHGEARPLAVRLAPPRILHDRAIFIDHTMAWIITQSLKDFANRSHAEIVRADDTASLKMEAYSEIWNAAEVVI